MMHSPARLASLPILQLLLASPVAAYLLVRPEAIYTPPNPTDQAGIHLVHPLDALPTPAPFFRRAGDAAKDGADSTTLVIDSKTCGFEDGLVNNAFQCVAETRSCTNDGTYIGCCNVGSTCTDIFPTTCIDFEGYESGLCDAKGQRTMCCTESQRGKCKTLTMLDELTGIACGSEAGSGTILLAPTDYDGPITTATAATRTVSIQSGGVLGSGQTKTSGAAEATAIDVDPTDDGEEPRPSTGAIIGGVVGAVAVFAIVICGAVWYVRRKKDDPEDDDLSPTAPAPLPYCIPDTAQTPPGSGSEYVYQQYPGGMGHYPRSSVPSSTPSVMSTIEHPGYTPAGAGANSNIPPRP